MKSMLLNFRMVIGSFWSMDKTKIILNRLVKKKLFNVVLQYRYTHVDDVLVIFLVSICGEYTQNFQIFEMQK